MSTLATCYGVTSHTPEPAEIDRHHLYPRYMSGLLGIPERTERVNLCSGCHDLVHHVLHHRVNEGTLGGHHLSAASRHIVDAAWEWWQEEVR